MSMKYIAFYLSKSVQNIKTVRPNSVAGEAGHVRLERPIDSSSDKLSMHRR